MIASPKMNYLNDLGTAFDTYNRNVANSSEVVNVLLDFALSSKEDELLTEILEVISSAQISQDLRAVDFKKLAKSISDIPLKFLPRCIDILGNTGDASYLPVILGYKNHDNRSVQQAVRDALVELRASEHD